MSTLDGGLRARVDAGEGADDAGTVAPAARSPWCVAGGLAAAVLAVASVAVVLLSDDARWLRLAVVAALWAALIGAAALVRRIAAHEGAGRHEAAVLRRRYARELEREVAARREYESTLERDVRRELAGEQSEEIAALREEVERLRARDELATAQPRLRVVGESAPPPDAPPALRPVPAVAHGGPTHPRPGRPTPPHPMPSAAVTAALHTPPDAPDGWVRRRGGAPSRPGPDPLVVAPPPRADGSFVDQYVRSTGYAPSEPAEPTGWAGPDSGSDASGPDSSGPDSSGPDSPGPGRTVAELIAAHAADGVDPRSRRRADPRLAASASRYPAGR